MAISTYFNAAYYLQQNPDVMAAGNTADFAWAHYMNHGAAEALTGANAARKPAPWFDIQYYVNNNADLVTAGLSPVQMFEHFTTFGISEGRSPANGINMTTAKLSAYATANADLQTAFGITDPANLTAQQQIDLANHYYQYGYKEDRPSAPADVDQNPGQTFTLTTAIESLVGTTGDDTFVGTNTTLNTGDSIDGAGGTDTLTVTMGAAAQPIATLKNVENVEFVAGVASNVAAINTGNWSGVNSLTVKGLGVTLADADGTAGWSFTGLQNNVALGISNVDTADNAAALYAGFASGKVGSATATLTLNLGGAVGATANTGATNVVVDTAGTDKFTKLVINSTGTNRVQLEGTAAAEISLTDITVNGAGSTNFSVDGTNAVITNLATVNASAATGAFTANVSASTKDVTFSGSSAKNTVTFGNGNNTITGGAAGDQFTLGTGNNTVKAGAGNDTVIGAVADFTKNDSIDLGEGSRDAVVYSDVTTLNSTGVNATALAALNSYSNVEVVGSSAAVTAVDFGYFSQNVARLSGNLTAAVTVSNVAGDTLELTGNGITGVNGDSLIVSGALPNQTFNLEMNGAASQNIQATNATAGNAALTIASGVSTVNITSTTSASSTTGVANSINIATAAATATHAVDNASAGSFVLTGNVDFNIGQNGLTAGFTKAVDFNASAFTGKLAIVASADADVVKGGTGDDTITGLGGNDQIDLTAGGKDTVVFSAAATNGKDTITGFGVGNGGDILDVDTAAGITLPGTLTAITNLTGAATIADSSIITVNFGAAIAGKAFTGADFGDLFGAGKVFSTTGGAGIEAVLVIQGTDQTQVIFADSDAGTTAWEAGDLALVGVLADVTNTDGFHISNFA